MRSSGEPTTREPRLSGGTTRRALRRPCLTRKPKPRSTASKMTSTTCIQRFSCDCSCIASAAPEIPLTMLGTSSNTAIANYGCGCVFSSHLFCSGATLHPSVNIYFVPFMFDAPAGLTQAEVNAELLFHVLPPFFLCSWLLNALLCCMKEELKLHYPSSQAS